MLELNKKNVQAEYSTHLEYHNPEGFAKYSYSYILLHIGTM